MDNNIVTQINESMEKLTAQITNKTRANDTFKEQVASKINAIKTLIEDIKNKMSDFSKTKYDVDILGTEIQNLTKENTRLKAEIVELEKVATEHGVTKEQLKQAEQQKIELEKQVDENNSTLATTESQRQALQTSLESILDQLNDKITALESLTPDTNIIDQLEEIRGELATLSGSPPPIDDIPPPTAGDDPSSVKSDLTTDAVISHHPLGSYKDFSKGKPSQTQQKKIPNTPIKRKGPPPPTGGKTRRHRKRRVSKRKTLKRKKLKGGYTADFEKKNKELRDKMRKRSKRHHSLRRPSSSTRKLSTSSKSSRRYKRSH